MSKLNQIQVAAKQVVFDDAQRIVIGIAPRRRSKHILFMEDHVEMAR